MMDTLLKEFPTSASAMWKTPIKILLKQWRYDNMYYVLLAWHRFEWPSVCWLHRIHDVVNALQWSSMFVQSAIEIQLSFLAQSILCYGSRSGWDVSVLIVIYLVKFVLILHLYVCLLRSNAILIFVQLKGRLVKSGTITHPYPFCPRSKTPLIYRAVPSW